MKKEKIINSIRKNCNVGLKPSLVCDGVGVFALVDIPEGSVLFADTKPDKDFISWDELFDIPTEVKKYLSNLCLYNPKGIYLSRTVTDINISYYVNHSENYNVFHNLKKDKYVTIKDIKKGEEILCLYTKDEIDW
jgi:SET domain-containing protein